MSPPNTRRHFLASLPAIGLIAAHAADEPALQEIVFGSCLDTHDHPMLDRTLTLSRDLFIFMGDNIYADKGGIPMMQEKYALLKNSRFFQGVKKKPFLATWDDHDFGQNDGGGDYPHKKAAQVEFYNWLDEPAGSPRRQQEGVYQVQSFGPVGKRVQVVMLDTRYFRSPLKKVPKDQAMLGGSCVPTDDTSTTMLGAAQWRWLEQVLQQPAELRLIVSSIQFSPEAHGGECWANMPHEQQRMMKLLQGQTAVILSGDRHWCEFSHNGVFDFTTSSMTQKHPRGTPTPNKNRCVPATYHLPNVGHLRIDWAAATLAVKVLGEDGVTKIGQTLSFRQLQIS
ncbi:alkaline phosphatase D family protein [Prosthecobacter sp.]|uniref:alkaline phosphatase D family protein n=1 Tax=Prosthecobacter sp. TaxID=1965333 RepID=UPI002489EC34|nr:alkaline phosphatase D family protein [Prosthecobacter sp.]MDI1313151.1 alkaline phosphatase D family protein [Prosthecobacter sp.]